MNLKIFQSGKKPRIISIKGKTLKDFLNEMNFWEENYAITRDNKIILPDAVLKNNDKLRVYDTGSRG